MQQKTQQVTAKDPKKVEAGKRLAEYNCRMGEAEKRKVEPLSQHYSIGAVLAVGVISRLGYYLYQVKKAQQSSHTQPPKQPSPKTNKLEIE